MNIRVADIHACYELWKSRGAEFITKPIPKYSEIRCYIRDPDGYVIEVGQSTDLVTANARPFVEQSQTVACGLYMNRRSCFQRGLIFETGI